MNNEYFYRWSMVVKLYIVHLYIVHTSYIVHRSFVHPASLFDAGILLNRLRGDSGCRLGAVVLLNVARRRRDRSPRFAACHSKRYCATRQQCQNDRLDDFVDLLIAHNGLGFVLSALLSECPFLSRPD